MAKIKIRIGNRKIDETDKVNINDIPIAFIDTSQNDYYATFDINKNFVTDKKEIVRAYQNIEFPDTLFFDKKNKIVSSPNIKRVGNKFTYMPQNAVEFTPEQFSCYARIKRAMQYRETKRYNMKVCIADETINLSLCEKMISIFGDAYKRSICPANIRVNSGSVKIESLIETAISDADFAFIESPDGITLPDDFDINKILSYNTTTWLICEDFSGFQDTPSDYVPRYKEGYLNSFYNETDRKKVSNKIVNTTNLPEEYDDYDKELLYDDVLLLSKDGGGSIIISPKNFFVNITSNAKIVYDVMMHIFLNSWEKSKTITSWITNQPVDYMAYTKSPLGRNQKKITLDDLLQDDNFEIEDEYIINSIEIDNENVVLVRMSAEKELYFKKIGEIKDPEKGAKAISYLTTKGTVVNYEQEEIYTVEKPVSLSYSYNDGHLYIIAEPIFSSEQQINLPEGAELEVPDLSKTYYLCTRKVNAPDESVLRLIEEDEYMMSLHGMLLAKININTNTKTEIMDIRIPGGGLPLPDDDDYDMLDIGGIEGRPLRRGGTLIFRLPIILKEHREKIEQEIKKHIVAGTEAILVFDQQRREDGE